MYYCMIFVDSHIGPSLKEAVPKTYYAIFMAQAAVTAAIFVTFRVYFFTDHLK